MELSSCGTEYWVVEVYVPSFSVELVVLSLVAVLFDVVEVEVLGVVLICDEVDGVLVATASLSPLTIKT